MNNPVDVFEGIRDFYLTYLETAFRIGHPPIQETRRVLLEEEGTLCTQPILEPVPKYQGPGLRIDDLIAEQNGAHWLPGFTEEERRIFVRLAMAGLISSDRNPVTGALRGTYELYHHQLEMLRRGIGRGTPGIVTSGTGLGKTEAFLLPVIATITREARGWPESPKLRGWERWWKGPAGEPIDPSSIRRANAADFPTFFRSQEHVERPKAVRALIVYPMNALVEDQLVRLRKSLDGDDAHHVLDDELGGNRIFFGRYTSATPVTGQLRHPRLYDHSNTKKRGRERDRVVRRVRELADWCSVRCQMI